MQITLTVIYKVVRKLQNWLEMDVSQTIIQLLDDSKDVICF